VKNLHEDYVFPIHLKQVDTLLGIPVYSSEELKERFIELVSNVLEGDSELSNKISTLTKKDKIVPCFVTGSILRRIVQKLVMKEKDIGLVGVFDHDKDKVFVLIDMAEYKMFNVSGSTLLDITIHELIHMAAYENMKKFKSLFLDDLKRFYSTFFNCYFNIEIEDIEVQKFVENQLEETIKRVRRVHFPLPHQLHKDKVLHYIDLIRKGKRSSLKEVYPEFKDIIDCLRYSYNIEFGIRGKGVFIQALFNPTEVICIVSTILGMTQKIKKLILSISD
jgi:hypothetical protein